MGAGAYYVQPVQPAVTQKPDTAQADPAVAKDGDADLDPKVADANAHHAIAADAKADGSGDKTADPKLAGPPPAVDVISGADPAAEKPKGQTVKLGGGTHVVTKGDSLWSLAEATYGKGVLWTEIKKANPGKVHGPKEIIIDGDTLVLPQLDVPTLDAAKGLEKKHPDALRDLAVSMTEEEYQGFLKGMSQEKQEKNAELLQLVEMMRATGMTVAEMGEEQRKWLEEQAKAKGVSVGDYIKELIAKKGYGGGTADKWNALAPAEKADWQKRFTKVVANIKTVAPPDVQEIIKTAKTHGGDFRWDPEEVEKSGAFAYTQGDWSLHCGTRFVEAAEADPSRVYANVSHEMGGHNFYGEREFGAEIEQKALDKMDPAEKAKALSGGNSMFSTYGYMETEIFAELYEFKYDDDKNSTDHPFNEDPAGNDMTKVGKKANDVGNQLQRIHDQFAPKVAEGLVRGLARRVEIDPRIIARGKELFRAEVKRVFGFKV